MIIVSQNLVLLGYNEYFCLFYFPENNGCFDQLYPCDQVDTVI